MRRVVLAVAILAACGPRAAAPAPGRAIESTTDVEPPEVPPDLTRPIREIAVSGLPDRRANDARAAIRTRIGDVADATRLRLDALAIWELGGIADVQIRARAVEGGVALTFEVVEQPLIGAVSIEGVARAAKLIDVAYAFGAEPGMRLDPTWLADATDRVATEYREQGFPFARVTWSSAPAADDGTVTLTLTVVEGERVTIGSIAFRGHHAMTEKELAAIVSTHLGAAPGEPYRADRLVDGLVYLDAAYFDRGHIDVHTGPVETTFSADRTSVDVVIPIDEGDRYTLGAIAVTGDLAGAAKGYVKAAGLKRGAVFSRSEVQAAIDRLIAHHRAAGKPAPAVTPSTDVDPDKHVIDVTFEIGASR